MLIKSSFKDIYDYIMSQYTEQAISNEKSSLDKEAYKEVVFRREYKVECVTAEQLKPEWAYLVEKIQERDSILDWLMSKRDTEYHNANEYFKHIRKQVGITGNNHTQQYARSTNILLIGLEVFVIHDYQMTLRVLNVNGAQHHHLFVLHERFNLLDKQMVVPSILYHKPIAWLRPSHNGKEIVVESNFALSKPLHGHGVFSPDNDLLKNNMLRDLDLLSHMTLEEIHSSIESRLALEREWQNPMVEIQNSDKVRKAGFDKQSFRRTSKRDVTK